MDFISENLQIIAECIQKKEYKEVETERFELKDLSRGWGDDWYKSVCSFLNTNGGVIVIGINDKNNAKPPHYKFTGYDNSSHNENHLKQDLPNKFTDRNGKPIDLTTHITHFEIRDFLAGKVVVVYIEELDSEQKYVYYNGKAYLRKLTGDHELSTKEIETYEEIKKDIIRHQELEIIKDAGLDTINIETLNKYIYEFNRGKKRGETYKKSLEEALPFLNKAGFIRENKLTLLGMLVCGNEPEYYLSGKCEADCYVIVPNAPKVAQSKQIIEDNIIELIKRSQNFVWRNIQIGIAYKQGGTAEPEYPESLIRESINNAFAHRDYKNDRFIIIEIRPQESLMIRNPGMFEHRQRIYLDTDFGKIRRIIPLQVARNPKLTHILKSFDYWEGKGTGLTSLIDACLDNQVDVPYYILSSEEIKLFIPSGKVLDEESVKWLDSFTGYIYGKISRKLNEEEQVMMAFFKKSEELNRLERYTILITADNNHSEVIATLEEKELIFKNPDSPELYPIYQIDRILMKKEFSAELKMIYGDQYDLLHLEYQKILQAIYLYNNYAMPTTFVSANAIATYIFTKKNGQVSDVKKYEQYRAKVSTIFNELESKGFIVRKDGKKKEDVDKSDFTINHRNYSE